MRRLLLAVLVLAACGGDSSRGPIADPAVFLHDLPVVECDVFTRCGLYSSVDDCLAARPQRGLVSPVPDTEWRFDPRILAAVERGTVQYSPARAGECLDAIRSRTCADFRDPA